MGYTDALKSALLDHLAHHKLFCLYFFEFFCLPFTCFFASKLLFFSEILYSDRDVYLVT